METLSISSFQLGKKKKKKKWRQAGKGDGEDNTPNALSFFCSRWFLFFYAKQHLVARDVARNLSATPFISRKLCRKCFFSVAQFRLVQPQLEATTATGNAHTMCFVRYSMRVYVECAGCRAIGCAEEGWACVYIYSPHKNRMAHWRQWKRRKTEKFPLINQWRFIVAAWHRSLSAFDSYLRQRRPPFSPSPRWDVCVRVFASVWPYCYRHGVYLPPAYTYNIENKNTDAHNCRYMVGRHIKQHAKLAVAAKAHHHQPMRQHHPDNRQHLILGYRNRRHTSSCS